jgi:hypothetical protein
MSSSETSSHGISQGTGSADSPSLRGILSTCSHIAVWLPNALERHHARTTDAEVKAISLNRNKLSIIPRHYYARFPKTRRNRGRDPRELPAFEELHRALVLHSRFSASERSQIPSLASIRVLLSRVEPVFARLQLPNHATRNASCRPSGVAPAQRQR